MKLRAGFFAAVLGFVAVQASSVLTQTPAPVAQSVMATRPLPPRGIRRDVPLTNQIKRAMAAGTRDFSGKPGPNYWQTKADYTITVKLTPETHTLWGTETIALANNGPTEMREIVMRLDHNIFRPLAPHAVASTPAEITDGMVITHLAIDGADVDLKAAPAGRGGGGRGRGGAATPAPLPATTTVSGLDQTVARITLSKAIPSKATATLEITWHTQLPGGPNGRGHRMTQRFDDTLFQPTQWYPRIAKYDDLRGWDTTTYMGPSEFYNNFGRFDVSVDAPAGWIVSGTGVLQNPQDVLTPKARERLSHVLESDAVTTIVGPDEVGPGVSTLAGTPSAEGNRLVWRRVAENVNDFAWAAAKNFTWTATRATIPGKGPIPIHMVFQPERANSFTNAGPVARHALEFYSKLWAPYPFPVFTLQDGPSAGMEYPMVINSNQGAADHETGHQWWPMMVGNNETWYGWMDEGFNQYMNILSGADSRGVPPNLNGNGQSYGNMSGTETEAPMMWIANDAGTGYSYQTYSKTPLMLSMLGGIVPGGDKEVQRAHSEYTKTWAFKHPSPWDYMFFMGNELKQDLGWFWYYWLFSTDSVDGSIDSVTTAGTKTTVMVKQDGQMPSPVVLEFKLAKGAALKALSGSATITSPKVEVVDDTTLRATWPVDVWFTGARTFKATVDTGGRKVESVMFDPGCRFPDHDPSDNVWPKGARAGNCR
jgi:hypothetical protein